MATAPVSRRLNLTRDQLAQFLTDQQQIRQFELLFSTVDTLQVIVGSDFEYQADNAAATANEALAQISALAQETGVNDAALGAKAQDALDRVALLAQETAVTVILAENKANQALELLDKLNKAVDGLQMTIPPTQVYPSGTGIAVVTSGTAWGTTLTAPSGAVVGTTDTQTLTNKRIDPRVVSAASASSLTPDVSTADIYAYTALAAGLTINAPTGTPVDGDKLMFRLLDNGTARALTWNATYTVIGVTLPTTTVANKTTYVGCIYNANNTRWDVIAVTTQA